jgi:peptidoglycan hydrolase-like protein with peptidoglycan-binding domain
MTVKITTAAAIFAGTITLVFADQIVESVQQALKEEGFYYGEVNGDLNANLTAAIRRYQIRNGLQVSGELNDETLRSLGVNSSGSSRTPNKPSIPTRTAGAVPSEAPSAGETESATPAPSVQPFNNGPQGQQVFPSTPVGPASSPGTVFADTPFVTAPAAVQHDVIVSAQITLARYGLYREQIDGVYGPAMELSLRAYQTRARLPVTGRLDMETLAAMRLLPGARQPFYGPYRRHRRLPPPGPPIHGQWEPD